jgi:hypothetical protein
MSGRDDLAGVLFDHSPYYAVGHLGCNCDQRAWEPKHVTDAILASTWLAARDAAIGAEALAPVAALVDNHAFGVAVPGAREANPHHNGAHDVVRVDKLRAVLADPDAVANHNAAIAAKAWSQGKHSDHTPTCRFGDGDCICPNPYRTTEGATCTTAGCPGDARYAAPGRGHIDGCTHPRTIEGEANRG